MVIKKHVCYKSEDNWKIDEETDIKVYICPICNQLIRDDKMDNNKYTKSYIWVTTQKEGFHFWKHANKSVGFLKYMHRHIFKFRVDIEIQHNEREIEFFMFKQFIDDCLNKIWRSINNKGFSCETISDKLYEEITKYYKDREIIIEVSEDGENGSRKYYDI